MDRSGTLPVSTGRVRKERPPPRATQLAATQGDALSLLGADRAGAPAGAEWRTSSSPSPLCNILPIDVEGAPAAPRAAPPRDPRLSEIKKELELADDDVRHAGEELIARLKVSLAAAFSRRVDSAVSIQGYQRVKGELSADAASFLQESTRLVNINAEIKAGRAALTARAKTMRADEEALKRGMASLEERKRRFDASAEDREHRADEAATKAEDAKPETLFRQLLNLIRKR